MIVASSVILASCGATMTARKSPPRVYLDIAFERPGAQRVATSALNYLESIPGMKSCELHAHHYVLQIHVLAVGPRLAFPIAGQSIHCVGSTRVGSRNNERRIDSLPSMTSANYAYSSSSLVGGGFYSHFYSPPQLFGTLSISYASRHLSDALRSLRSLEGVSPCATTVIRGREDATATASSDQSDSVEMSISFPNNGSEEALYCAGTSNAAVKRAVAVLHARFPGVDVLTL